MLNSKNYILAAVDDPSDRYLLKKAFEENAPDHDIVFSINGEELLARLTDIYTKTKNLPRMILLDLNMPKLNGIETLRLIRNDTVFKTIPVLMLSENDTDENVLTAYKYGANTFIKKPLTYEGLLEFIKTLD